MALELRVRVKALRVGGQYGLPDFSVETSSTQSRLRFVSEKWT